MNFRFKTEPYTVLNKSLRTFIYFNLLTEKGYSKNCIGKEGYSVYTSLRTPGLVYN